MAIIIGSAVVADVVCSHIGVSARRTHEVSLMVLMFGAVISANDRLWPAKLFWVLAAGILGLYLLAVWFVVDSYFPSTDLTTLSLICLAGAWWTDVLLARIFRRTD